MNIKILSLVIDTHVTKVTITHLVMRQQLHGTLYHATNAQYVQM